MDWSFLEGVLTRFGFCQQWINWVMTCVRSVRYAVKLNGEILVSSNPLSLYLFLFVAEGLSRALEAECAAGKITPLRVARGSPGISHLLFADDSLLFFKADSDESRSIKNALNKFQHGMGQLLSPSKCSMLFSRACPAQV